MPTRFATCQMVSRGRAATTLPSRVKWSWSVITAFLAVAADTLIFHLITIRLARHLGPRRRIREMLERGDENVRGRLPKPAN